MSADPAAPPGAPVHEIEPAVYHRRFYPDDVAGTVAYVAPLSFGAPDHRYDAFLDGVQPAACRDAVRAVAVELLRNRWDGLLEMAQASQGGPYQRVALGPALRERQVAVMERGREADKTRAAKEEAAATLQAVRDELHMERTAQDLQEDRPVSAADLEAALDTFRALQGPTQ